MSKEKDTLNYRELNQELSTILDQLDSHGLDIDEALRLYERGQAIAKQLEGYLKEAENKVAKVKAQWDKPGV